MYNFAGMINREQNFMTAIILSVMLLSVQTVLAQDTLVLPSEPQVRWQQMETNAFVHFGPNTFMDREWGYGDADPAVFRPSRMDADQWMETFKAAGIKGVILTCKHHDGFCLWPTKYTDYNISRSLYKDGKGDIVREVSEACGRHGLKFGIYLSPWDRHQASYGTAEYVDYYYHQLEELLTGYGEIFEVWLDGANGGDGWYGGAKERREIDRRTYYHFERAREMVARLQPQAVIFSDGGPGCRWVGNERGVAATTNWSLLRGSEVYPGYDKPQELPEGHADGDQWTAAECDVSIRPGWFYHQQEDSLVKSAEELAELYYQSVGRNALLLLNFPVDREGRVHPVDSATAVRFRQIIGKELGDDLLADAAISRPDSHTIDIRLDHVTTFDCLSLQEDIRKGQRVQRFVAEYGQDSRWLPLPVEEETTTIGYKRILRFPAVRTDRLRVRILASRGEPQVSSVSAFRRK